jgi:predicted dehydrogenase
MSIRVGLIGLNYGAQVHLPAIKANPRYDLVAVCARTPGRAEAVAHEHGVPRWYTDPRKLIASKLDLVAIASPPSTHAGYTAMALAAGKHVLVEVAYVANVADARVLAGLAREHGRVGAVAYPLRFVPAIRHVGDVLALGGLGRPRLLHMDFYSSFLAQRPNEFAWLWAAEHGGGIVANFLVHAIDMITRWFGPVGAVESTLETRANASQPPGEDRPADDTGLLALHLENGLLATFSFSATVAVIRTQIAIHGTTGSLLVQGFGDESELLSMGEVSSRPLFPPTPYLEETRGETGLLGGLPVLLERLASAIGGGHAPDLPSLDEALEIQRIVDAARRSAREKRQVLISEV